MKRAAVPLLALVIAVVAAIFARQSLEEAPDAQASDGGGQEASRSGEGRQARGASSAPNSMTPSSTGRTWTPEANRDPSPGVVDEAPSGGPEERGPSMSGALTLPQAASEESAEAPEAAAPLQRYERDDARTLRRARQIELVVTAQQRAEEQLEDAEEAGDEAAARRTRQVLRQLGVRLRALEEAATSQN